MDGNGEWLIRMNGITKIFLTEEVETHALSGVHLGVRKGEYVSIAGPSGCGKSTLLSIMGLLDAPTAGEYYLHGHPVAGLTFAQRTHLRNREIGFVFQNFNLIGDLRVFENVELPLTYRNLKRAERRRRVEESLERVGMSHRMNHFPSQLSGGQQQRVAVARALVGDPRSCWRTSPPGTWTPGTVEPSWSFWTNCTRKDRHDLHRHSRSPLCRTCRADRTPLRRADRG